MIEDRNEDKHAKEGNGMGAAIKDTEYTRLDFSTLNFSKQTIASEEALKDVTPMQWSEKVLNGEKQVIIKKQ